MTANNPSPLLPKLRFPEFRDAPEWSTSRGNTLFDSINNRSAAPGLPVLAITQEHGAIPRDQIDYHVSVTAESVASYKEVCEGDFIISLRSFQGGIEHSRYHGICSPAYVILRRKGSGNDHFFRHLFKSERFIQQLTRNIEGIRDGKMISYAQFSEQLLPVPEPPEQSKIADCLGSLDALIAAKDRKLEALRQHKQGLMQQLFPQPGETVPRLRFSEFRDAREWAEVPIATLLTVRNERHAPTDKMPLFSLTIEDGITPKSARYSREFLVADPSNKKYKLVKPRDIVFNPSNLRWGAINYSRLNHSVVVSPIYEVLYATDSSKTCFDFVARALMRPGQITRFIEKGQGTLVERIAVKIEFFLETTLQIPPHYDEQQKIAECLGSLDDLIAAEDLQLEALRQHKRGLIQQLFPSLEGR